MFIPQGLKGNIALESKRRAVSFRRPSSPHSRPPVAVSLLTRAAGCRGRRGLAALTTMAGLQANLREKAVQGRHHLRTSPTRQRA